MNPKAQAKYHENRAKVERKLKLIKDMLKAHRDAAGDNLNWGYVGDLVLVNEHLDAVIAILGIR